MKIDITATKLVVRDVDDAEQFYAGLGLLVVSRNTGGEDEVRQRQSWMSATGDRGAHMIILSQFLELPPPPRPSYPNEVWLAFQVADVDAICASVERLGGKVVRAGQDRPEHGVRAAVVSDREGHIIEIVGPIQTLPL